MSSHIPFFLAEVRSFCVKAWGSIRRAIALLTLSLCALGAGSQKAAAQAYAPVLTSATSASPTSVTLTWTESDPQGGWFRVVYGTSSGNYTASVDVGGSPTTVTGLTTGTKYYFAVQFYESGTGKTYGPSNELSCTPTPPQGAQVTGRWGRCLTS